MDLLLDLQQNPWLPVHIHPQFMYESFHIYYVIVVNYVNIVSNVSAVSKVSIATYNNDNDNNNSNNIRHKTKTSENNLLRQEAILGGFLA